VGSKGKKPKNVVAKKKNYSQNLMKKKEMA
jgi:hypothetical protein